MFALELLFSNGDHYSGEWVMDKASGQVCGEDNGGGVGSAVIERRKAIGVRILTRARMHTGSA